MAQGRVTINLFSAMTWNPDLFAGINLPPGVDREMVEDAILDRCAECALLYTDPEFLQSKNIAWFNRKYYNIQKLFDTTTLEYDTLNNVNMSDSETIVENRGFTRNESEGEENSSKKTITEIENETSENNGNSTANTETTVSAFNNDGYQPDNNVESNGTTTATIDRDRSNNANENIDNDRYLKSGIEDNENRDNARNRKWWGLNNKEPQDLISKERQIALFNIYETIAQWWESDFCYAVYV